MFCANSKVFVVFNANTTKTLLKLILQIHLMNIFPFHLICIQPTLLYEYLHDFVFKFKNRIPIEIIKNNYFTVGTADIAASSD